MFIGIDTELNRLVQNTWKRENWRWYKSIINTNYRYY